MTISIISENAIVSNTSSVGRLTIIDDNVMVGDNCIIGDFVKLSSGTIVGNGCILDDYVNTSGPGVIGNNVLIKRCSMIGQAFVIEDNTKIGPNVTIVRLKSIGGKKTYPVHIGQGVEIGAKSLIFPGVTIGEKAIIGAGSIVTRDCESYSIYYGSPAKLIRRRDVE